MPDETDRRSTEIHQVKTEVEILKRDVSNIQNLLGRLDLAIDKIADATGGISKILAVHESQIDKVADDVAERKRMSEKSSELLHRRISEMKDESQESHRRNHEAVMAKLDDLEREVTTDMKEMSERVTSLEKWKWYIMGGSWVIGFVIASITDVAQFFK